MGCLWWVSPKPLGQACWRCLVVPVTFWLGVSPGDFCLGVGCHVCSFGGWVVCGLWSPGFCGRPLMGLGGCVTGVVFILCGLVFSLSVWR